MEIYFYIVLVIVLLGTIEYIYNKYNEYKLKQKLNLYRRNRIRKYTILKNKRNG